MLRICMKNAEPGAIYWPNLDLCLHLPTHNSQGVGLRWSAIMFTYVADFEFHKHYIFFHLIVYASNAAVVLQIV